MGYCVFMLRPDSIYDDSPAERYQFPEQYLRRVETSVSDWIVYLEPTKLKSSRGYFAIARVREIVPDPTIKNMYLALIEQGTYLDFSEGIPFSDQDGPIERGVLNEHGRISGRAQSAVRPISSEDFLRIIERGLDEQAPTLPREGLNEPVPSFAEDQAPYALETERLRVAMFTSRAVRDRVFRRIVLRAYDERCAITGLKFINGGGRAEVDAAHIRPVQNGGPDIIHNGIALSGTAHWMFDRGLISLSDDLEILISRHVNDFESVKNFINKSGRVLLPTRSMDRPSPHYIRWHRENYFKN